MAKPEDLIHVGVLAREVIRRIDNAASRLATEVEFNCEVCRDDRMVLDNGRYRDCPKCGKKSQAEKKSKFQP